jgi:hypothetical protein
MTKAETQRKRVARMKEQHRCTRCGNQDARTLDGKILCAACAEREKEAYRRRRAENPESFQAQNADKREYMHLLRDLHVCKSCKRQDAFTLNGRAYCAECAAKNAERKRKWRGENPEESRARSRQSREKYAMENRCTVCGKPLPYMCGFKTCASCREHSRQLRAEKRWRENPDRFIRGTPGICYRCVKRPVMEGKKVCKQCYESGLPVAMANLEKANVSNMEHPWRRLNRAISKHGRKSPAARNEGAHPDHV